MNNLLERLHASYFFYLFPRPGKFIPVGNYLPAVILLGASITLNGFDIPTPVEGLLWMVPPFLVAIIGWLVQSPLVSFIGILFPKPDGTAKRSMSGMAHLLFGAIIPTLGMVNFPQAVLLGVISTVFLAPWRPVRVLAMAVHPFLLSRAGVDLRWEWEVVGNLSWIGVFAVWVPLSVVAAMI
jgi:glycosylphosphatidylinositol transamidase